MNNAAIIAELIHDEGGLVDDPADAGGITKFGITISTYSMYLGRQATPDDIRALTAEIAALVYDSIFIQKPGFAEITNDTLRWAVVDAAVQHWVDDAAKWLQAVAGVTVDGHFGPISAAAINAMDWRSALAKFLAIRIQYYGTQITVRPLNAKFAKGWMKRVTQFLNFI